MKDQSGSENDSSFRKIQLKTTSNSNSGGGGGNMLPPPNPPGNYYYIGTNSQPVHGLTATQPSVFEGDNEQEDSGGKVRQMKKSVRGNGDHPPYTPDDPDGAVYHFYYDLDTHRGKQTIGNRKAQGQGVRAFVLHLEKGGSEVSALQLDPQGYFIHDLVRFQLGYQDFEALANFVFLDYLHAYDFLSLNDALKIASTVLQPNDTRFQSALTQSPSGLFTQPNEESEVLAHIPLNYSLMVIGYSRGWAEVTIDGASIGKEGGASVEVLNGYVHTPENPTLRGFVPMKVLQDLEEHTSIPETTLEINETKLQRVKDNIGNPDQAITFYWALNPIERSYVDPETRYKLVRHLVGETGAKRFLASFEHAVARDEAYLINELVRNGQTEHQGELLELLKDNEGKNFELLQESLFGQDFRAFHETLGTVATEQMGLLPQAELAASLVASGSNSPKMVVWSDPGVMRENYDVQTQFSVEFTEDNKVLVRWTEFDGWESLIGNNYTLLGLGAHLVQGWVKDYEERIYDPYEPIAVRFLIPEAEFGAKAGDIRVIPAINLFRLEAKEDRQEIENKAEMGLMALGAGEVGAIAEVSQVGWRGALGMADMMVSGSDLVIRDYQYEISQAPGGEQFLFAWNVVSGMISLYGLGRLIAEAPNLLDDLFTAWSDYQDLRKLGKVSPELAAHLEEVDLQVEATFEQVFALQEELDQLKVAPDALASANRGRGADRPLDPAFNPQAGPAKSDWSSTHRESPIIEGRTPDADAGFRVEGLRQKEYALTPDGHHIVKIEVKDGKRVAVIMQGSKTLQDRFGKTISFAFRGRDNGLKTTMQRILEATEEGTDEELIAVTQRAYSFLNEVKLHQSLKKTQGGHRAWGRYRDIVNGPQNGDLLLHLEEQTEALHKVREGFVGDGHRVPEGSIPPRFKSPSYDNPGEHLKPPTRGVQPVPKEDLKPQPYIPAEQIHSMQSSVSNVTGDANRDGSFQYSVLTNAIALRNGSLSPSVLGPIKVWKDEAGKIWTLDHRRLVAYKLAGYPMVPTEWAHEGEVIGDAFKMSTEGNRFNWGKRIEINIHMSPLTKKQKIKLAREGNDHLKYQLVKSRKGMFRTWTVVCEQDRPFILDHSGNKFFIEEIFNYYYIQK